MMRILVINDLLERLRGLDYFGIPSDVSEVAREAAEEIERQSNEYTQLNALWQRQRIELEQMAEKYQNICRILNEQTSYIQAGATLIDTGMQASHERALAKETAAAAKAAEKKGE